MSRFIFTILMIVLPFMAVHAEDGDQDTVRDVSEQRQKPRYVCGIKQYCKEMESCEEAMFYFKMCRDQRFDRDNDGIPCENVCAHR